MNFCLENKMNILFVLLVMCHFIGLLASPVSQKNDEYPDEYYYEEDEFCEDCGYEIPEDGPDVPENFDRNTLCELPPELDYAGEDFH